MILRRVIQHFRKQEWTAIAIDLVIVVVGVYIGIQAQSWNTDRENRLIEKRYLRNLHDELLHMIDSDRNRVAELQDQLLALKSAMGFFTGSKGTADLASGHCYAIAWSHVYVAHAFVPPTIEELLSTGRLQLIDNSSLRSEMVAFSQTIERIRQLVTDIQADRLILSRAHPNLISLHPHDDEVTDCDFQAMAQSQKFLNDVADNRSRYEAYVKEAVVGQQDSRIGLHLSLDKELGLRHPDETSN